MHPAYRTAPGEGPAPLKKLLRRNIRLKQHGMELLLHPDVLHYPPFCGRPSTFLRHALKNLFDGEANLEYQDTLFLPANPCKGTDVLAKYRCRTIPSIGGKVVSLPIFGVLQYEWCRSYVHKLVFQELNRPFSGQF
jgi:hypothetical protein